MASGVSTVEGTIETGAMIFVGISACCGCFGYSLCGISGCSGPAGAPGCAT